MVLSNDYIECQGLPNLPGTVNDGSKMKLTCKSLGFAVYCNHNFTQASLISVIDEAKKIIFPPSYKRLIFVFAGHGNKKGQIFTSEGKKTSVKDIIESLSKPDRLKHMARIFLFDACRGDKDDQGRMVPVSRGGERAHTIRVPDNATNYLVAYSTIDGYRSYEESVGGIWMQCVADKLLKVDRSIMDVLTVVNGELNKKFQNSQYSFQIPELSSTLQEDVNLFREAAKVRAISPEECPNPLNPPHSDCSRNLPVKLDHSVSVPEQHVPPPPPSTSDDYLLTQLQSFKTSGIICDYSATDCSVVLFLDDREKTEVTFKSKGQERSALRQALDFLIALSSPSVTTPPISHATPPISRTSPNLSPMGIPRDQYVNKLNCYISKYHKDKPLPTYTEARRVSEQVFVFTVEHEVFGTFTGNACRGKSSAKQTAAKKAIIHLMSTQQWM